MQGLTPLEVLRGLPWAAEVFDALSGEPQVHAVGGAVRDVLLGRSPSEVDLVVVGDATRVARRLGEQLSARVRVHERFKTATLELEGAHFDLASARRERYPAPGSLPEVELGASLDEDLARRDFTLNAIAIALADGRMTAHPWALEDLDARQLRVLHPASFRDDPTRLLRLGRYAGRLELAAESITAELAAAALEAGALDTVSGERVGRELRLAAAEPQPETLRVLAGLGVLAAVLGDARRDEAQRDDDILERALELCPPDGRRDLLALAATSRGQDPPALAERLRRLAFTREEADRIVGVAAGAPRLASALVGLETAAPSVVWDRLDGEPVEALALAAALSPSSEAVATVNSFLGGLRHVRPLLSGHDLQRAGLRGPAVGRGLTAARAVALDSPAAGRDEQLAAALSAAGKHSNPRH